MSSCCPDADFERLAAAIAKCPPSNQAFSLNDNQKSLVLAIKKLKRFLTPNGRMLIKWAYNTLKDRTSNDAKSDQELIAAVVADPVSEALADLVIDCIAFHEAIDDSVLNTLFELGKGSLREPKSMLWFLCLVAGRLPDSVIPHIHEYIIQQLSVIGCPYMDSSSKTVLTDEQSQLSTMAGVLFDYLLLKQESATRISLRNLLEKYTDAVSNTSPQDMDTSDVQQNFRFSYILSLPRISVNLVNACWKDIFNWLFVEDAMSKIYLYESKTKQSLMRTSSGEIKPVASVFSSWLYNVAFDRSGLIMKHALDVAIVLDAMAHKPQLGIDYLLPTGDRSLLESLRPSFEQLELAPASIDLVDWVLSILKGEDSIRNDDHLMIPLFLLELAVLRSDNADLAVDTLVKLITKLDRPKTAVEQANASARYLILNLISATETKWPGIVQTILERIFSKAIALHIADSEGSVNVEKILGNLAMLFEEIASSDDRFDSRPGFNAFKAYIMNHWRHVLLLFVNHPSMECRALGYRVLCNSHFWEEGGFTEGQTENRDVGTIARLLMDAWFRHMKNRYLIFGKQEEAPVLDELQRLIARCCLNLALAKSILSVALDGILGGTLEKFPAVDIKALQREQKSMLSKIRDEGLGGSSGRKNGPPLLWGQSTPHPARPPQFLLSVDFLAQELEFPDKIYIDNIQRTARLFLDYQELQGATADHCYAINSEVLAHLSSGWPSSTVPLDAYDDALPRNIPSARDITIGNTFKDHPVLFLIIEKCCAVARFPLHDVIRSVLVYFIAFWNMAEVAQAYASLKYATQMEETIQIILLLKEKLPPLLRNTYRLFPFMSALEMGAILHNVIWPYIRWHPESLVIPGLEPSRTEAVTRTEDELTTKCFTRLQSIYKVRVGALDKSPSWQNALKKVGADLGLDSSPP